MDCDEIYQEATGDKSNKWLKFSGDPDHDRALVEVCALRYLFLNSPC